MNTVVPAMRQTIKSKRTINELFNQGMRIQTASILAIVSERKSSSGLSDTSFVVPEGRTAVIAGKKLGSAPCRSRAKRLIREATRTVGAPWRGYDVLLIAKKKLLLGGFVLAQSDIQRISLCLNKQEGNGACNEEHLQKNLASCGGSSEA